MVVDVVLPLHGAADARHAAAVERVVVVAAVGVVLVVQGHPQLGDVSLGLRGGLVVV